MELRIPFSWEERRPVLLEKFFYLPSLYDGHENWQKIPWNDDRLFGNDRPVALECCSGNGQWICQKAKEEPDLNWVALELRFDRARKIWGCLQRERIPNLFVLCGDARLFARHYLPKETISRLYVNFPDPWPKKRHAKHRLLQRPFVDEAAELLLSGAEGFFVTDDPPYANEIVTTLTTSPFWRALLPSPHYKCNPEDYGRSFFLDLWKQKGKSIHLIHFQKR
ncbi:MAG: tRNA (guanine(46)-N(7))-methyltransferase TrmB [Verrucomicrobiota bacterium]|nr:tRNA (guanine(46)-N(7))-methyltransferase TrmB [Verrucomicrobiota bacterium]